MRPLAPRAEIVAVAPSLAVVAAAIIPQAAAVLLPARSAADGARAGA